MSTYGLSILKIKSTHYWGFYRFLHKSFFGAIFPLLYLNILLGPAPLFAFLLFFIILFFFVFLLYLPFSFSLSVILFFAFPLLFVIFSFCFSYHLISFSCLDMYMNRWIYRQTNVKRDGHTYINMYRWTYR